MKLNHYRKKIFKTIILLLFTVIVPLANAAEYQCNFSQLPQELVSVIQSDA